MPPTFISFSIEIEHFALVTYRVEAERLRRRLPDGLHLQTFHDDGIEYGLVSTTCFLNRDFRPTALQVPRHTFYESTYRAYIDYGGEPAVYFFGRYLGSALSFVSQRAMDRHALRAEFDVEITQDASGYEIYSCTALGADGETRFQLAARDDPRPLHPWATGDEHAQFITFRPIGSITSTGGFLARARVEHDRLSPWQGTLQHAKLDLWERLDLVSYEEAQNPYSVLISTGTQFKLYPPVPARPG